jgi:tRNA 2-(methylsulfanyl)-N6-isopentenyladenosine37 hydroxylase
MAAMPEIRDFLLCETPQAWINAALENQSVLLIDHANCEKKAAATAMNLLYRYIDRPALLHKLSRLAREELRHFEQVLAIMQKRGIDYVHVSPSRYASALREGARTHEPAKLVDTLICGALIEARSCERFEKLAPYLDTELKKFYLSLLKSEARHFQDYLKLARQYAEQPIDDRIALFAVKERELIESDDPEFRFHSGAFTQESMRQLP